MVEIQNAHVKGSAQPVATPESSERVASPNRFKVLETPQSFYGTRKSEKENEREGLLIQDIHRAQRDIAMNIFLLGNDRVGGPVLSALKEAALRGVSVQIMTDRMFPWGFGERKTKGIYKRLTEIQKEIEEEGIRRGESGLGVGNFSFKIAQEEREAFHRLFNREHPGESLYRMLWRASIDKVAQRDHTKLIVIDADAQENGKGADTSVAYIGGRNIFEKDANNIDCMVRMTGPIVKAAKASFDESWEGAPYPRVYPPSKIDKEARKEGTWIVRDGRDTDLIPEMFTEAIANAKDKIWIQTPYFDRRHLMPLLIMLQKKQEERIAQGLKPLDIRFLTPIPKSNNDLNYRLASPFYMNEMAAAGIQVYGYIGNGGDKKDKSPKFNHSKLILVDDLAILGSSNFSRIKILGGRNAETELFSREKELVDTIRERFEHSFHWGNSIHIFPNKVTFIDRVYRLLRPRSPKIVLPPQQEGTNR